MTGASIEKPPDHRDRLGALDGMAGKGVARVMDTQV